MSSTIEITIKEYEALKIAETHLLILEARGVDNWQGWCNMPIRDDFDTEQEYDVEIGKLMFGS